MLGPSLRIKKNESTDHGQLSVMDIYYYYTSREFPIQNFHRRTTDIL